LRIFKLAALFLRLVLEADREGQQLTATGLGQQCNQQTGIQPAREQQANRHIGDLETFPDGPHEDFMCRLDPLPFAHASRAVQCIKLPVPCQCPLPVGLKGRAVCRRQLAQATQQGAWCRHHGMQGQVLVQCNRVDAGLDITGRQ
jgi:hypothetical protein